MSSSPSSANSWLTAERLAVVGLLAFTLLVRSAVMWAMQQNLVDDPDAYRQIAENLLAHGVFGLSKGGTPTPTAYRPPLYPILLSNLPAADGVHISLVKVAALHVLLGVLTVWLTFLTARQLCGAGFQPALVSALLVTCDPILLNQQTLVMTETLAAFLAILSLWCLARFDSSVVGTLRVPSQVNGTRSVPTTPWWNAGLAGGAIALAALCRPTFLPWLGLVGVGAVLMRPGNFRFQISDFRLKEKERGSFWTQLGWRMANGAGLAIVAAAVMLPWAIRNQRVFGKPILTTTHGGYTLLLGNNWKFYRWFNKDKTGLPWDSERMATYQWQLENPGASGPAWRRSWPESEFDRLCYIQAREDMTDDPATMLWASVYRIRQLWSPLPYKLSADESMKRSLLRYATAAWYCGVYLLVAVGVWRLRWQLVRPPWVWGVLLCLTFTAVHTLYWCNLRMRAPLMPFVAIVAGAGLAYLSPAERLTKACREVLNKA